MVPTDDSTGSVSALLSLVRVLCKTEEVRPCAGKDSRSSGRSRILALLSLFYRLAAPAMRLHHRHAEHILGDCRKHNIRDLSRPLTPIAALSRTFPHHTHTHTHTTGTHTTMGVVLLSPYVQHAIHAP